MLQPQNLHPEDVKYLTGIHANYDLFVGLLQDPKGDELSTGVDLLDFVPLLGQTHEEGIQHLRDELLVSCLMVCYQKYFRIFWT